MFERLRKYRVHGRTAHERFGTDAEWQHTRRPSELLVSAFDQPPNYESAIRLDFGAEDHDGGWIKLPRKTIERLSRFLSGTEEQYAIVSRHEGVCIDVQSAPEHQHGTGDVREVIFKAERIERELPHEKRTGEIVGCELTLGTHNLSGASLVLTSAQTEDLVDVLNERLHNELHALDSHINPPVVQPDGTTP